MRETSRSRNPYIIYNLTPELSELRTDIIVTEIKLDKEHKTSECLHKKLEYKVHRPDKRSDCGGVLIAVQECLYQNKIYNDNTGVIQWIEVNLKNQNKKYIGGLYCQPDHFDKELRKPTYL